MGLITNQLLRIGYLVVDPSALIAAGFTSLRFARSTEGPNGPYIPVTDSSPQPATIRGGHAEPHALSGKSLHVQVNGELVEIDFVGSDPYTTADAVMAINSASVDITAYDNGDSTITIATVDTGTDATLEILPTSGALALGFQPGQQAVGLSDDPNLSSSIHDYFIDDHNSSEAYWYQVVPFNSGTLEYGAKSVPFPAISTPTVPWSQTIACYIKLLDFKGRGIQGRKVLLSNTFRPNILNNFGIFRHYEELVTDCTGYATVRVIRGMELDVNIEGTGFTRRITLPGVGAPEDIVNLLDPSLVSADEFGIQEPNIDFAIRTS